MSGGANIVSLKQSRERRLHLRDVAPRVDGDDTPSADAVSASSVAEPAVAEPAPGVGAVMKSTRLERGIDEIAVCRQLKISAASLRAIEADDFASLPGRTYALGHVRAYATLLGLDGRRMVEQFKLQVGELDIGQPVRLVFPEAEKQYRLPSGSILVVAAVLALVIYALAQVSMPSRREQPVAARDVPSVVVVDPDPASASHADAAESPVVVEPGHDPAPVPGESEMAEVAPAEPEPFSTGSLSLVVEAPGIDPADGAAPEAAGAYPAIPPVPAPILIASASATFPVMQERAAVESETLSQSSRITLTATAPSYVQIKDPALRKPQSILIARVMQPGESFQVPDRSGLVLLTGNAGGIQAEVDGKSAGTLGKAGEVIKRLELDAGYFQSRLVTSQ